MLSRLCGVRGLHSMLGRLGKRSYSRLCSLSRGSLLYRVGGGLEHPPGVHLFCLGCR